MIPRPKPAGDRDLDRSDLLSVPQSTRPRSLDPDRIRDHHDHTGRNRGLRKQVTKILSSPEILAVACNGTLHVAPGLCTFLAM